MALATPVKPFVLKDVDLLIALDPTQTGTISTSATDFAGHVSTVHLSPSSSSQTWSGLKPDSTFTEPGSETWECELALAQDWSDNSLASFLFDNAGKPAVIRLTPRSGIAPGFDVSVFLVSPEIGGDVDSVATSSVTLGVHGRPKRVENIDA